MNILGIDIGGSGIKAAIVDVAQGKLVTERQRLETPQPATPDAVAQTVATLTRQLEWQGPIGCTFPAVVRHGIVHSAANVDESWIDTDGVALFEKATGQCVTLLNDADAAGLAEMRFGAGKDVDGLVLMLTFGTGIGSAFFLNGKLIPNSELGHIFMPNGKEAEEYASARIREEKELSWERWAGRVQKLLDYLDGLFSPDLFIVGGGVSRKSDKFVPLLKTRVPLKVATLYNEAGIVGAALAAHTKVQQ